jgi:hypothetical protein
VSSVVRRRTLTLLVTRESTAFRLDSSLWLAQKRWLALHSWDCGNSFHNVRPRLLLPHLSMSAIAETEKILESRGTNQLLVAYWDCKKLEKALGGLPFPAPMKRCLHGRPQIRNEGPEIEGFAGLLGQKTGNDYLHPRSATDQRASSIGLGLRNIGIIRGESATSMLPTFSNPWRSYKGTLRGLVASR